MSEQQRDIWAQWLTERRSGGDAAVREQMLEKLRGVRDELLDRVGLREGETLLDVGCGEGLIGFGALERGAGHVVFADVSQDLLDLCRDTARELGVADRSSFVRAAAEDLRGIDDASVDVVATRAVLIYVEDKRHAFAEFFRVLRRGGRVALREPINRFGREERKASLWGYPTDGVSDLAERVERVFEEIQPPDDPMLDFDERDLIALAEETGFFPIELGLEAEIRPIEPRPWPTFLDSSPNPKVPTLAEAIDRALTAEERERFARHLRPLVERGEGVWRMAHALLLGTKPPAPIVPSA